VILFWEVWCPHCQVEVPRVQELYAALKEAGVEVVALTKVSGEATDEKVRAFIKKHGIQYTVAKEDGTISESFGVMGVPAARRDLAGHQSSGEATPPGCPTRC
jgi:peroxiredoxin